MCNEHNFEPCKPPFTANRGYINLAPWHVPNAQTTRVRVCDCFDYRKCTECGLHTTTVKPKFRVRG